MMRSFFKESPPKVQSSRYYGGDPQLGIDMRYDRFM